MSELSELRDHIDEWGDKLGEKIDAVNKTIAAQDSRLAVVERLHDNHDAEDTARFEKLEERVEAHERERNYVRGALALLGGILGFVGIKVGWGG